MIGASVDTADKSQAKILKVGSGSPAEKAGMRKGDIVTDVAGEHVPDGIALIVAIRSHRPGDTVAFTPYATCPLPPAENKLSVRIEAGEKKYGNH